MNVGSSEEFYIPESYAEYMEQIETCRKSGDQQALAKLREEFSEQFPLLPAIWLCWIEEEIEKGSDQKTVEVLFERSLADFHSDQICAKYIEWACGINMTIAKEKLEQVVSIIGLRPDSAHIVWESYLDIVEAEFSMLSDEDDSNPQKSAAKSQLKALFDRALRVPHQKLSEIYERYLEFIGDEKESTEIRASFEASEKAYTAIQKLEDNLLTSDDKTTAYAGYIAYEQDGGNPSRIQMIFERAIVEFPFSPDLWLQYTAWMDSSMKIPQLIISTYDRACKMCYDYSPLWQQSLLALERIGMEYESLETVWTNARAAIQSEEEGVSVFRTYIYLTHRYLKKTNATEFTKVEKLFREAIKFLKEEFGGRLDSTMQLRKNFAYFLYSKSKKPEEARSIWNEILSSGLGNTASAWLEAIGLERHFGGLPHTRRMLYMAVNSVTDKPFDVFNALVQFEREEGTLQELDKAIEKVNAQAIRLKNRPPPKERIKEHASDAKKSPAKRPAESQPQEPQKKRKKEEDSVFKKPRDPQPLKNFNEVRNSLPSDEKEESNGNSNESAPHPSSSIMVQPVEDGVGFKYATGLEKNKLFVRNVDFKCTDEDLKEFFAKYGKVVSVRIVTHKNGTPKGVAYVEYTNEQDADKALAANDSKLKGRKIKVFISNPPSKEDAAAKRLPFLDNKRIGGQQQRPNFHKFDENKPAERVARAGRLSMVPRSISKASVQPIQK